MSTAILVFTYGLLLGIISGMLLLNHAIKHAIKESKPIGDRVLAKSESDIKFNREFNIK